MKTVRQTAHLLVSIASLLVAMNALPATPQTFDEAVAAYMRGDYATAFLGFYRPAERGDADSQYALGFMYGNGDGIPQDHSKAEHWYRLAAEQGHADAQYDLAFMYGSGEGVPRDDAEAEAGTAGRPNKAMPTLNSFSGSCTTVVVAFPETMPRRCTGTAGRPSKAMPMLSTTLRSCVPVVPAFLKTTVSQQRGTAVSLPRRSKPTLSPISG